MEHNLVEMLVVSMASLMAAEKDLSMVELKAVPKAGQTAA
jgi:hypothetical protein